MDALGGDARGFGFRLGRVDQPFGAADIEMRLGPKAVDHRAEVERRRVIIAMQMQRIAETLAQGIAVGHDGALRPV